MDLRNLIQDDKFKLTVLENKINIVNYLKIDAFDDEKIIVRYRKGIVIISGNNLSISKLIADELLINGDILKLEFR